MSHFVRYNPPMPEPTLTAVTLDAGNTLIYCDPSPAEIYSKHIGRHGPAVAPEVVEPAFRGAWAEMHRRTAIGADRYSLSDGGERAWWGAFVREVLARLDHPAPWRPLLDDLWIAFAEPDVWQVYPDTRHALTALKNRGVPLGLISNWDRRLPDILDGLDLTGFFDVITVSSIEGVEKPSPEIFHRTLDRMGLAPEGVLHVGDSPRDDYRGAAAAGLSPRLIDRKSLFAGNAYQRIESLIELLDLVV